MESRNKKSLKDSSVGKRHRNTVGNVVIKRWLKHKVEAVEDLHNEHLRRLQRLTAKPLEIARSLLRTPNNEVSVKKIKEAEELLEECSQKLFNMFTATYDDQDIESSLDEDDLNISEDEDAAAAEVTISKDIVPYYNPPPSIELNPSSIETLKEELHEVNDNRKTNCYEESSNTFTVAKLEVQPRDEDTHIARIIEDHNKEIQIAVTKTEEKPPVYEFDDDDDDKSICSDGLFYTDNRDYVNVMVSHCISPSSFYLQKSEECKTLLKFQMILNDFYNNPDFNAEFKVTGAPVVDGHLYVALYEWDMSWYRAVVVDVGSDDDIEILFVDYGNKEIISKGLLRYITPDFKKEKYYAEHCSIASISAVKDNTGKEWPSESARWFCDLLMDRNLQMKKTDVEKLKLFDNSNPKDKCHPIDLYYQINKEDESFMNVAGSMKELGLATAIKSVSAVPSFSNNYFTAMLKENDVDRNLASQLATQNETNKNAYNIYENLMRRGRAEAAFALHSQRENAKQ